jgi:hypothetical protein
VGGTNRVTVTFGAPAKFVDLRIVEYAGLSATNAFDVGASSSGNGSAATSTAVTTSAANELLFAAGMTLSEFTAAGAGFTSRVITSPDSDLVEDAPAPSPGSYTATAPVNASKWLLQVAAFRPAP